MNTKYKESKQKDIGEVKDSLFILKMKMINLESYLRTIDPYKDETMLMRVIGDMMKTKGQIEEYKAYIASSKINWVSLPMTNKVHPCDGPAGD